MTSHTDNVVERPADLSAAWLTSAIGAGTIADFAVERIGTGQMSECYRVQLTYADGAPDSDKPDSVVLKVAATDPMSRQTGMTLGLYAKCASTATSPHGYEDRSHRVITPHSTLRQALSTSYSATRIRLSSVTKSAAPQRLRPGSRSQSWPACRVRCSVTPRSPRRHG